MGQYTAFGLTLTSDDLPLPQLLPGAGTSDVTIRYGPVPDALSGVIESGPTYEVNSSQVLFRVEGVGRYLVQNAREIVIERDPTADEDSLRLFLLGSALGALLHQRGLLPLHGSAIETPAGALLLAGVSGVGKSTTAAAFLRRGYRLLTDDVCAIGFPDSCLPVVYPGYPQQKLWDAVLDRLASAPETTYQRVRPQMDKFAVPVRDRFCDTPLPLRAIYILIAKDVDEIRIEAIEGIWRLHALHTQIYRGEFTAKQGGTISSMKQLATLANHHHIRLCGVFRPSAAFRLDELVDKIETDFRGWTA